MPPEDSGQLGGTTFMAAGAGSGVGAGAGAGVGAGLAAALFTAFLATFLAGFAAARVLGAARLTFFLATLATFLARFAALALPAFFLAPLLTLAALRFFFIATTPNTIVCQDTLRYPPKRSCSTGNVVLATCLLGTQPANVHCFTAC
jgi:hypothetical protein